VAEGLFIRVYRLVPTLRIHVQARRKRGLPAPVCPSRKTGSRKGAKALRRTDILLLSFASLRLCVPNLIVSLKQTIARSSSIFFVAFALFVVNNVFNVIPDTLLCDVVCASVGGVCVSWQHGRQGVRTKGARVNKESGVVLGIYTISDSRLSAEQA